MKNSTRAIVSPGPVCALVLATACTAHADLRDDLAIGPPTSALVPTTLAAGDLNVRGPWGGLADDLFAEGFSDRGQLPVAFSADENIATGPRVRELPAAPDSASLFLSAVLSVGAWHLVRSTRQITGHFPAWYHTEGPRQIGATVRFVPDEHLPALFGPIALAALATAVARVRPHPCVRRDRRMTLAIAVPRGPPFRVLTSRM